MVAGRKATSFKRILLNKCQEEFEQKVDWDSFKPTAEQLAEAQAKDKQRGDDIETRRLTGDCEYRQNMAKKRMLGNIKFIGELFKKQMLTEKIMHHCVTTLLSDVENPEEDYVESARRLWSLVVVAGCRSWWSLVVAMLSCGSTASIFLCGPSLGVGARAGLRVAQFAARHPPSTAAPPAA